MDLKSVTLLLLTTQYVLQSYQGGLKYFKSLPRTEGSPLSLDLNVETQLFSLADLFFLDSFFFFILFGSWTFFISSSNSLNSPHVKFVSV